jgi:GSH-dependent disulfide-bond oxidoreductase
MLLRLARADRLADVPQIPSLGSGAQWRLANVVRLGKAAQPAREFWRDRSVDALRCPAGAGALELGGAAMIDLYTWATPNGHKASIMLEETGVEYAVHPVDIANDEQFAPDYEAINPNGKIPAIVDQEGPGGGPFTVFESGAILIYLAEKTGSLLPATPRERSQTLQWLMFQVGGLGPMLGQAQHFRRFAPQPLPYALERYSKEAARLYRVLDKRLGVSEFLAGNGYSIADIACFPWVGRHEWQGVSLADHPNVQRWFAAVGGRPAVRRGMQVPQL